MKVVTLNEVCEINPKRPKGLNPNALCSFVPMENVNDEFGFITKLETRRIADVERGYTYFFDGDVLFAKITPCMENGKGALARELTNRIGFGSTEFHVVRARDCILPEWIHYYLRLEPIRQAAQRQMTGSAGQRRVPASFLADLEMPLPSLREQKRIVAIIAKADRLRRLRRYALELSSTYLQSVFLEMFGDPAINHKGWSIGKLKELCNFVIDCPHSTPNYSPIETPYLCVRSSDIQSGFFDWSTTKCVSLEEYHQRVTRLQPKPGDVVYCREGARFGNAAIIPEGKIVCLGQRTMLFRANHQIATPAFIWGYLESASTYKEAERLTGGSASPHLNVGEIKNFATPIPPLQLQEKFTRIFQHYERLRAQQREAARQAEHLFQTLLHHAFRGQLATVEEAERV